MRYLRIIVIAVVLILASACFDNLEFPTPNIGNSDKITVIGRITRFDDHNVQTRAVKQPEESVISSYAMAIFHIEDNQATECVYYETNPSATQLLFNIDRKDIEHTAGHRYAIYVFANMPGMDQFSSANSLDEMLKAARDVEHLGIPDGGFPMIGSLGDNFSSNIDRDNQVFVMTPEYEAGKEMPAPKVDGKDMTTLSVPMKALFAKMNFQIEVRPDQMIEGSTFTPQFLLKSYKIVNVPNSIDFRTDTNPVSNQSNVLKEQKVEDLNVVASGARTIDFSFYLPENLQEPLHSPDTYDYPFLIEDNDGNKVLRPEDEKYRQRYKGLLLSDNQPATHIVLVGEFRDHQNHVVDVEYTIHLGKDNYSDFNVVRNGEYDNYITIRGALNSSSNANLDPNVKDYISVDHRVNITHREPTIISLRREVLLDSHYEVRPLRIKYNDKFDPNVPEALRAQIPSHVKVEVLNSNTTNWMRLERSAGKGSAYEGKNIYITENGPSKGKRKFFTTDLVSGSNSQTTCPLGNSTSVVVPIPSKATASECVWIYVDEVDPSKDQDKVNYSNTIGDGTRSGTIKVTYGNYANGIFTESSLTEYYPSTEYVINQRKLFPVSYTEGSGNSAVTRHYYIEYEEEYLHNFDSDEGFGLTDYEGMPWGLPNTQLSYDHQAILMHNSGMESLTKNIRAAVLGYSPYYDFYLKRDFNRSTYYFENETQYTGIVHDHNGFEFCKEIIAEVNSTAHSSNTSDDIKVLTLAQEAKSAIEYCYNKNKRDANGNVVLNGDTGWYLPAIDEAEEIMMSQYIHDGTSHYSYARFEDFQNKYYWSSQPAFYQNIFLFDRTYVTAGDRMGHYMTDNPDYARATKVDFKGGDPSVSTNYELVLSGMKANTYYQYLYFVAGGSFWEAYPDVKSKYDYIVKELISKNSDTNTGGSFGSDSNGKYFQFKWDNNDVDETTEKVYAPQFQDGYKHRTQDMARVRCVRKLSTQNN